MKIIYVSLMVVGATLFQSSVKAQEQMSDTTKMHMAPSPIKKWYWSNGMDMAIFSTSFMQKKGEDQKLTTLRFTFEINYGLNLNYDFSKSTGFFTGVGIKNIGFIEKVKDSTIKRRVYTIGVPLGFKFGNLKAKNFFFIGGGADIPFNYREKGYVERKHKEKFNEWFTDRTPLLMPYAFIGFSMAPGVMIKLQYYPDNFLNTDYRDKSVTPAQGQPYPRPYAAYENLKMLLLNVGFNIDGKKPHKHEDNDDDAGSEPAKTM